MGNASAWVAAGPASRCSRAWTAGEFQNTAPPQAITSGYSTATGTGRTCHRPVRATMTARTAPTPTARARSVLPVGSRAAATDSRDRRRSPTVVGGAGASSARGRRSIRRPTSSAAARSSSPWLPKWCRTEPMLSPDSAAAFRSDASATLPRTASVNTASTLRARTLRSRVLRSRNATVTPVMEGVTGHRPGADRPRSTDPGTGTPPGRKPAVHRAADDRPRGRTSPPGGTRPRRRAVRRPAPVPPARAGTGRWRTGRRPARAGRSTRSTRGWWSGRCRRSPRPGRTRRRTRPRR